MLDVKNESVVEGGLPILASVVGVSFVGLLVGIKECFAVGVTGALPIHGLNVFSVPNYNSNLEILAGFRSDIPNRNVIYWDSSGVDSNPQLNNSLGDRRRGVIQLPVLDRFILDALPLRREKPVFKVNASCTNKFIAKYGVIVENLNVQGGTAREDRFKIEVFIKLRIRLIINIQVPFIVYLFAQINFEVRIRETTVVSGSQIVCASNVEPHYALSLG